ncbi:MAG: twin-arginine translocase TatA/TatE family subunit [Dehalogenimonas sp.]|jgi:sec-independent protein translocase protein TatA|uniref:Twin-arginine translocase TatA/TatE family subunit n=1 Tax=Candidatus Dehalogenimonas loeffleri TaxID=3127115 RepID=A0ABZ2J548_9CHLR|nr:twin-arginine translocase TatA/TatE family subunit [Dehalogenimonas sp.]
MRFGVLEIILVVVIILLITGAAFVPAVSKNLGKGVRQLRQALGGKENDDSPKVITKLEDGEAAQEINRRAKGKSSS